MATFRGAMRSAIAAASRMEREQQRRAREAARYYKQQLKLQEIENNSEAVQKYQEYIYTLKSVHKDCSDYIDWSTIKNNPEPCEPMYEQTYEEIANKNLKNYKPSFFSKLFGADKKQIRILENEISQAKIKDKSMHEQAIKEFNIDYSHWKYLTEVSIGVLNKNPEFYKAAISYFEPFAEIYSIGSGLDINFNTDYAIVNLNVNSTEIIPNFTVSQTSSGKLSKKNLPISKFNELYQDYVCSCVLRTAREILTYLPIKYVVINAIGELLNSSTGYIEKQTILSVIVPPENLNRLNFETIDPSDSLKNFMHNMKFSKTNGFSPVENCDITKFVS